MLDFFEYMARLNLTQARTTAAARTTPTYPRTPVGGVYIPGAKSIEGATGDTARTTTGWIESVKYQFYLTVFATAGSAEFDTAITRTGLKTLKLSTTDATGRIYIDGATGNNNGGIPLRLKPSTAYVFSCYVKTTNAAANSVYCRVYDGAISQDTSKLAGTNNWTLLTKSFTTGASLGVGYLNLYNVIAGNISDAWFDVNSLTLIETGITRNAVV